METLLSALLSFLRATVRSRSALALENTELRQQLTVYQRTVNRPRLRRLWPDWNRALIVVKPQTVTAWHRHGFKLFWRRRSRFSVGRPTISRQHIAFINRISSDHPEWGEDKIAEELAVKFGVHHSPSTVRRYMVPRRGTPRGRKLPLAEDRSKVELSGMMFRSGGVHEAVEVQRA